jgi:hypothetical protein
MEVLTPEKEYVSALRSTSMGLGSLLRTIQQQVTLHGKMRA